VRDEAVKKSSPCGLSETLVGSSPVGEAFCDFTALFREEFKLDSFEVRDSVVFAAVSTRDAGCDKLFFVPVTLADSFLDSFGKRVETLW
jgi:hypothetical protein